ncbi:Putative oxidoreductase CatD [Polystyrenella longa]|uniref:Oxidoreductase CatD n=1 Tax=Polystyrenella longa TaxID=2528007 RepID=A0A518CUD8_9PLAN|nr:DoxX family protein [Polystyrenella longa]QDU82837.1 Putative oxidoreductase CatD [Polystyrenella longa]
MSSKLTSFGLLVLRIGVGGMMMVHGLQKFQNFEALSTEFADPIGVGPQLSLILAIGAELGCSVLVIAGLLTRLAVIPLAFTMIIAHFQIMADKPWGDKELSALYLVIYASLLFTGAGCFSIDKCIFGRKKKDEEITP